MKRRNATAATKRRLRDEQGNRCAFRDARGVQCTMPIQIWEHGFHSGVAVAIGNEDEPDAGLCRAHAYLKTVNEDNPRATKARKQAGEIGQAARRAKRKAAGKPAQIPARPFGISNGFDKRLRKRMDGTVEIRLGAEIER